MRQFFTLRYWATLLALVGVALGVMVLTSDDGGGADPLDGVVPDQVLRIDVDLITPVFGVQAPQGIQFVDGRLVADIALLIDATRTMVVKAGTPGDASCVDMVTPGQCVVAADLLGDAVLRFDLVSGVSGATLKLPAVMEMLDGQKVLLANGWVVPRALRVERLCNDETTSLPQFISTYGDLATSTFDVTTQELFRVTCPRTSATTTTLPPVSTVATLPLDTAPGTTEEPG